jgi:hypothetical protein
MFNGRNREGSCSAYTGELFYIKDRSLQYSLAVLILSTMYYLEQGRWTLPGEQAMQLIRECANYKTNCTGVY